MKWLTAIWAAALVQVLAMTPVSAAPWTNYGDKLCAVVNSVAAEGTPTYNQDETLNFTFYAYDKLHELDPRTYAASGEDASSSGAQWAAMHNIAALCSENPGWRFDRAIYGAFLEWKKADPIGVPRD